MKPAGGTEQPEKHPESEAAAKPAEGAEQPEGHPEREAAAKLSGGNGTAMMQKRSRDFLFYRDMIGGGQSGGTPAGRPLKHAVNVLRAAGELVYPRRCPVCDRPVKPAGALICPECEKLLQRVEEPVCRRCGKQLRSSFMHFCSDCSSHPHIYERGCAVFTYHSAAGGIFRFKYKGRQEYGGYYGRCMAEKLEKFAAGSERPDLLIPVPVSADRLEKRGYNQALILAREISRLTGIPMRGDILRRVTDTLPMKNMAPAERQNNLKRAFQAFGNDVSLNSIMLIDDIYTTGATIDACAHALYERGADRVCFMTLAIGEDSSDGC